MRLGIKNVIRANHMISLIISSTTDPISGMDEQLDRITDLQQASRIASYESIESFYIFYGVSNPQR